MNDQGNEPLGPTDENKNLLFDDIHKNYSHMNQMMRNEMYMASKHQGLTGNFREEMWMKFFRSIIPRKYSLAQGVLIIDSEGKISKEVDIAVYDETYTPYIFQYNTLKFIPIEAVAVVIECKSTGYDPKALKEWDKRIKDLKPCRTGIARMVQGYVVGLTNGSQTRTRPITILATLKKYVHESTENNIMKDLGEIFDFVILDKQGNDPMFEVKVNYEDQSIGWWGEYLNEGLADVTKKEDPLLSLQHVDNCQQIEQKNNRKMTDDEKAKHRKEEAAKLNKKHKELHFNDQLRMTKKLSDLKVDGNPLLTLNLQLNQLLMLLNNPMLFPHFAYAVAFNRDIKKAIKQAELEKSTKQNKHCNKSNQKGEQ
ncbi:DUF6602 domain-containing protein [Paenibacillus sp. GCM10012307]|uniref:DUF6602 domain-containing protein n=1 Tax=Paenibacillus TaxID=44249 RepID=UPI001E3F5356|nr:DUF6602 domain-containing protein [Paenibacillus roseus]